MSWTVRTPTEECDARRKKKKKKKSALPVPQ
jgi:hypothetical protein